MRTESEDDFILHAIIPLFEHYGYPSAGDFNRVKVKSVPVRVGSRTIHPDIVYYQDEHPVLIVEAKRPGQSEAKARDQAFSYLKCFPKDAPWLPHGLRPKYVATAIGSEVIF